MPPTGYTAPDYKLTPLIEQTVKDAPGRVFIAFSAPTSTTSTR
jgi:hypothetical protein